MNEQDYIDRIKKLERENDALKHGYGVNCESCTSRLDLNKIRDINNRIVALKEDQMVINYSDLQMDGIAFVTIDQMKNYMLTAYRARCGQIEELKNKIATYEGQTCYYCECCGGTITPEKRLQITKNFLDEVVKEIQEKFKGESNG
jgi:RNA polymerase-binding transcription factor DksA